MPGSPTASRLVPPRDARRRPRAVLSPDGATPGAAMSALLQSLATPDDGTQVDEVTLAAIMRDGLPGPRSEAWKYTSLRALERRRFGVAAAAPPAFDAALLAAIPAPRLVFVNGRVDTAASDVAVLPAGLDFGPTSAAAHARTDAPLHPTDCATAGGADAVFARLAAALGGDGLRLRVAAGIVVDAPLHLVCIGTASSDADVAWHLRHVIDVAADAAVTLVEHQLADGAHRHLDNARHQIHVGAGARLTHARVQRGADGATSLLRTDATLDARAAYHRVDLELGAGLSRHELNVRLAGDGARLTANGVLAATGRRHVDTRLGIEHVARDTACELLWRGLGEGRGRVVFYGGITIHAGADGSDANLSNKNLLLSADAEIDTQPVLVIHADEVKAAHGATVGQLDAGAMFYLRSRGLPEDAARRLLTAAFVREPLAAVGDGPLRDRLQAQLDAVLGGLDAP